MRGRRLDTIGGTNPIRTGAPRRSAPRTCLVAVDGSETSVDVLVWGFRHAANHDMSVEVLTIWPPHRSVLIHEVPGHFCDARWSARAAQQAAIRMAVDQVPDGPAVAATLENDDVASAIVRASARHDLVVLGRNPRRGPHRLTDRIIKDALADVVVVGPGEEVEPQIP